MPGSGGKVVGAADPVGATSPELCSQLMPLWGLQWRVDPSGALGLSRAKGWA